MIRIRWIIIYVGQLEKNILVLQGPLSLYYIYIYIYRRQISLKLELYIEVGLGPPIISNETGHYV